jgi:hypothetical protein
LFSRNFIANSVVSGDIFEPGYNGENIPTVSPIFNERAFISVINPLFLKNVTNLI